MRKIILFLSLILLVSCNQEDIPQQQTTQSRGENVFYVGKSDIEKVVNDYLLVTNTRSGNPNNIVRIDSINAQSISTRNIQNGISANNLLFFVKISDGSTVVVAGDKRAEPIYAHFNNIELNFRNGKLINQEKLPEPFLFMLGTLASSIYNRITTEVSINPSWRQELTTRSSDNHEETVPQKCFVNWGQESPFNLQSPPSNGKYADQGRATAGCVPIALAQALTVFRNDFSTFKGYRLKTSWSKLRTKKYGYYFSTQDEQDDISNIIKKIAENIGTTYNDDGSAGTKTKDAVNFLSNYLGGMFSYDTDWNKTSSNMKNNSYGISIFSGHRESNGWLWNVLGIKIPAAGHCMLLDGYQIVNGKTLYYINFGWNGVGNGYYLYDDKVWKEDATRKYNLKMNVYNFHIDTDYDDF